MANKFCTNCGAPIASPHTARNVILIILAIIVIPSIIGLAYLATNLALLNQRSANGDLAASSISYSLSHTTTLTQYLKTATGDDFTVTLLDASAYYRCDASCDGSCFGHDYSKKYLTLNYRIIGITDPTFSFEYSADTSMIDDWYESVPDFSTEPQLTYWVKTYLERRDTPASKPNDTSAPDPDTSDTSDTSDASDTADVSSDSDTSSAPVTSV